ncbi:MULTISPECIES: hypothetical protein [unclassified Streptomyces]|uniref:hypothetical protein n=1 Tax=unclassified Streptomyces TaxID=2593676 RepID=UPI000B82E832|nr:MULTISPECIES: hypothetical protein [unclassified Streptomyces]
MDQLALRPYRLAVAPTVRRVSIVARLYGYPPDHNAGGFGGGVDAQQPWLIGDGGRLPGGPEQAADAMDGMHHAGAFAVADARATTGRP